MDRREAERGVVMESVNEDLRVKLGLSRRTRKRMDVAS